MMFVLLLLSISVSSAARQKHCSIIDMHSCQRLSYNFICRMCGSLMFVLQSGAQLTAMKCSSLMQQACPQV